MTKLHVASALVAVALAAGSPMLASEFKLYGAYQDTDARDDTAGGGASLGFSVARPLDIEVRAAYLEKLEDDPFDPDDDVFFTPGDIQMAPVELGLRFALHEGDVAEPYVGAGATYYVLDSNAPGVNVDDEVGWYASLGSTFGNGRGMDFFVEGLWRDVEATVEADPQAFGDVDDISGLDDNVAVDLGGLGANAGLRWKF